MKIHILFRIIFICLVVNSCEAVPFVFYGIMKKLANKKGEIVAEGYTMRITPACSWDYPEGAKDSCVLYISVNDKAVSVEDTLVFFPTIYNERLTIAVTDGHKWRLTTEGEYYCTSHQLQTEKSPILDLSDGVKAVFFVDVFSSYMTVSHCRISNKAPYYITFLYDSRRGKSRLKERIASHKLEDLYIEWSQSESFNYTMLFNANHSAIDTLRWAHSPTLGDSWEFLVVNDTIVLSDDALIGPPVCTTPFVIRRGVDLREQYPQGYKSVASEQEESGYPATLVEFKGQRSLFSPYRGKIAVSQIHLPSSPLKGRDITDSFMKENVFLIREE